MRCQRTGIVEDLAPVGPERGNVAVDDDDGAACGGRQMFIVEGRELREARRQFIECVKAEESDEKEGCRYATGETPHRNASEHREAEDILSCDRILFMT